MKRITFTPTEEQAKFINLYQRVQGASTPQEVIAFALDQLEQEQKYALYDKLAEMLEGPTDGHRTTVPATEGHD